MNMKRTEAKAQGYRELLASENCNTKLFPRKLKELVDKYGDERKTNDFAL